MATGRQHRVEGRQYIISEAALKVLQQARAYCIREITEGILAKTMDYDGKDTEATVNAQFAVTRICARWAFKRRVVVGVSTNEAHTDPIPRSDYILRAETNMSCKC